jgi:hypothetical protein
MRLSGLRTGAYRCRLYAIQKRRRKVATHPKRALARAGRSSRIRRKNVNIDQEKLDRVIEILGSKSETEAIDQALDAVLLGEELNAGIDRLAAAGDITNYFDDHPEW